MEDKLGVLCVRTTYVVASLDGVATHLSTVETLARASVLLVVVPQQLHLLHLVVVVVAMLAALSVRLFVIKCLSVSLDTAFHPSAFCVFFFFFFFFKAFF